MPDVKIDSNVLANIAQSLANAAMALNAAISPQPSVAKKKGRPPKPKPLKPVIETKGDFPCDNTEILEVEDFHTVIDDPTPPPVRSKEIFSPKSFNNVGGAGVASSHEDVTRNRGQMKFVDIKNVPSDKVQYPEPTDRRQPAKQMEFTCDKCSCKWMAYPSEMPQAFIKERIPGVAEGRPLVKCNNCIVG
jgi:hypothetical protein